MQEHNSVIAGYKFIDYLCENGIIPENCNRVILEADIKGLVTLHYTVFGDERLLEMAPAVLADEHWEEFVLNRDGEIVDTSSAKKRDYWRWFQEQTRAMLR